MESLFSTAVLGFGIACATLAFTLGAVTAWHLSARYTRRLCQRDAEIAASEACRTSYYDGYQTGQRAGLREADRDYRSGYVDGLRDARTVRPTLTIVGRG